MNKKDLYIGKSVWSSEYGRLVIKSFSGEGFVTTYQPGSGCSLTVPISSLYESPIMEVKTNEIPEAKGTNNKVTMKSSVVKPDYYLLPHDALNEVAMVLAKSKDKYPPENWRDIPNWRHEFYSAAMRHMQNWRVGKTKDDGEGGLGTHHLANAICNLMFILDKELKGDN